MNKEQALEFINNALNQANLKGVFTLQDAVNAQRAISVMAQTNQEYLQQLDITKDLVRHGNGYISKNILDEFLKQSVKEQVDNINV